MAKFKVCVQQYVEETAVIEVEAGSAEEACNKVSRDIGSFDPDWGDGDDTINQGVYAVLNAKGVPVWER